MGIAQPRVEVVAPGLPAAVTTRGGCAHRVLLVIDNLAAGGAQRHVLMLAEELVDRGHEALITTTGPTAWKGRREVSVERLAESRLSRRADPEFTAGVVARAHRLQPTVVHAHLFGSIFAGAAAAAATGAPLVVSHHSHGTWQSAAQRAAVSAPLRGAAHHFAASRSILRLLVEQGVDPAHAEVLPNWTDADVPPTPAGRPGGALRVCFLGRYDDDKDPLLAVEAVAAAAAQGVSLRLTMHGEGPLEAAVRDRVAALDMGATVSVEGFAKDVDLALRESDVLLLSSRAEGMPLAVLEAMARGIPVVATAVGEVTAQVGGCGRIVPAGDAVALAAALRFMAENPRRRRVMGGRGRDRVRRRFSADAPLTRLLAVYDRLADRRALATAASL